MIKAALVNKDDNGYRTDISEITAADLPEGDVTVQVDYSTLNFKDSLAITGSSPIIRSFPMVPGVDLAGTVSASDSAEFAVGDKVVLNGFGVGERHSGGMAQTARLKSDWLIKLPDAFTTRQAMAIGTAGYTAMLCVMALEKDGIKPEDGTILVTGAAGGVGSVAVALLAKLGYTVAASTGRPEEADYLKSLGATDIVDRNTLSEKGKPLARETWAGAIDSVGSYTLANVCAQIKYGGSVAACGLAQGADFPATVMPFILRGVSLRGIDSVMLPKAPRIDAWNRLAQDLDPAILETMTQEISLDQLVATAEAQMKGQVRGRTIVNPNT